MGNELAIGIDLGGTKIELGIVNTEGHLLHRVNKATNPDQGADAVIAKIAEGVAELQSRADNSISGVGIGVAGQIEAGTGLVHFAPNLGWHEVPLASRLHSLLNLEIFVTNDVRAAAMGEWLHGAGKGCNDLICLYAGTGIGSGIISGGRLLTGDSNSLGEVGHMILQLNGPPCTCGNYGCFEALAGGWAIARAGKEAAKKYPQSKLAAMADGKTEAITAKTVLTAAEAGDEAAREIYRNVIEALGGGISNLVNILNPQKIIIGGGIIAGWKKIIGEVEEIVRRRALKAPLQSLEIKEAMLMQNAGVVGSAAMVLNELQHQN